MQADNDLRELAGKVAEGDVDAAERLFRALHGHLVSFLYLIGIPDGDIDDVAQQTAIQLYRSLPRYRQNEPFLPWLRAIARNMAGHFWRTRARQEHRHEQFRHFVQTRIEQDDAAAARAAVRGDQLRHCVERLPEPQRRLLRLRYEEGLNAARIAERLSRNGAAVRKMLARVREALRDCLRGIPAAAYQPDGSDA